MRTRSYGLFALGAALILLAFFAYRSRQAPPIPEFSEQPTDIVKIGNLVFDNPGLRQDTPYLVYEEPGKPALTAELVMDAESVCSAGTGSAPCMAMSVQWSVAFKGKRAIVEGFKDGDDKIIVRKLRVLEEGQPALPYDPGHVFIPWPKAVSLIENCSVDMVTQTHSLDIYLSLKNGKEVVTVEPTIDEVFKVVTEAQKTCGSYPVATE